MLLFYGSLYFSQGYFFLLQVRLQEEECKLYSEKVPGYLKKEADFLFKIPEGCACKQNTATYIFGKFVNEGTLLDLTMGKLANWDGNFVRDENEAFMPGEPFENYPCGVGGEESVEIGDNQGYNVRCNIGASIEILFPDDSISQVVQDANDLPDVPITFFMSSENVPLSASNVQTGTDCTYDPETTKYGCENTHFAWIDGNVRNICDELGLM